MHTLQLTSSFCPTLSRTGDSAGAAQGVPHRGGADRVRGPHLRGIQAGGGRDRLLSQVSSLLVLIICLCLALYLTLVYYQQGIVGAVLGSVIATEVVTSN